MTAYSTIANSQIDQDSPVTQTLMTALRDNPIAITEGASGAPRNQPQSMDVVIGSGSGSTGSATTYLTITGIDDIRYLLISHFVSVEAPSENQNSANVSYALYDGSWTSNQKVCNVVSLESSIVWETRAHILDTDGYSQIRFTLTEIGTGSASVETFVAGLGE